MIETRGFELTEEFADTTWKNVDGRKLTIHGIHDGRSYWVIDENGCLGTIKIDIFLKNYRADYEN